ncbi:hypothetical protein CYLTODRAFT_491808 [Cylindrobasidium torrendii FP15055 ss-10]|uniref:ERCC4 domain-containing protein n=1 Tax=Cylindrobasidium torrendii FP15055 ss-10 TaxID=1314674 RepID=A0A0D7B681_9AGAR|nr:hypothetical protein CYLTODRAFT_491808 [Cylindrobasidium torrendii FP15055 ss-10]
MPFDDIVEISDDEDDNEMQFSQTTAPPSSQAVDSDSDDSVIILTDEDEPPTPKHSQPPSRAPSRSSNVISISDDDSDPGPSYPVPRSSLPSSSHLSRRDDNAFDSDEDEDLPDVPLASGSRKRRVDEAEVDKYLGELKSARNASTSSLESMPPSPKKRKIGKERSVNVGQKTKVAEDKAAEKAKKAEMAAKLKADEKAEKAKAKAEKKRLEEEEKKMKKLMSDLNLKVTDKKATLKTMQLIFSHNIPKPLQDAVKSQQQLVEYDVSFDEEHAKVAGCPVITWTSTLSKRFDSGNRQFVPCEETTKQENAALLYLQSTDIITLIKEDELSGAVDKIRTAYGLDGLNAKLFIMVVGPITASAARAKVEASLARLQIRRHTHHIHVKTIQEAADRLYNLTADFGIKPYKLIERSHLPFCADVYVKKEKEGSEIWPKMLTQIHMITDYGAKGIVEEYPTLGSLMQAYKNAPNEKARENLLSQCTVERAKSGEKRKNNTLGQALSKRVYAALYVDDPFELLVGDHSTE